MPDARRQAATRQQAQLEAAVEEGLRLARRAGCSDPGLREAVWELLLEAAETLRRLPDRERGWLTAAARAQWPDHLQESAAALAGIGGAGMARIRPAAAGAEAIDRMDLVLQWLPLAAGRNPKRNMAVLFGLASGHKVAALRRALGCGRRTIYDIRDRGLARICGQLRATSPLCRRLK